MDLKKTRATSLWAAGLWFASLWLGAFATTTLATTSEAWARSVVAFKGIRRGEIVVRTGQRRLYYGLGRGKAIRYVVGVGKRGRTWTGTRRIIAKRLKPAWSPPKTILRDKPHMKRYFKGGARDNPMGAAALLLGNEYAIHGTNRPGSIGGFVSYGCIRMHNSDILDLYRRVGWGTRVRVTR